MGRSFQNFRRTAITAGMVLYGVLSSVADAATIVGAVFDRQHSSNAEIRAL